MSSRARESAAVRQGVQANRSDAVAKVRSWIAGMVYGAGWRLEDTEAAIQESTLRVLHLARAGRVRADADFKSFVMTVARHTCTDMFRKERLRARIEAPPLEREPRGSAPGNPERALEAREKREILRYVFQELSEDCRRLWRWVYGRGMPSGEVARRLGITAGNARVRVHRCLEEARTIHGRYLSGALAGAGDGDD
jgi:RNA polymerase sigma factor (sigma-70 family)